MCSGARAKSVTEKVGTERALPSGSMASPLQFHDIGGVDYIDEDHLYDVPQDLGDATAEELVDHEALYGAELTGLYQDYENDGDDQSSDEDALAALVGAVELARRAVRRLRVTNRLFADLEAEGDLAASEEAPDSRLAHWLTRAGHRAPRAPLTFVWSLCGTIVLAIAIVWGARASGVATAVAALLGGLPVVGPGFASLVTATPWLIGLAVAGLPIWLVQRDRARRVEEIEQDLPLVLELLATLAEAGLGFESAVDELLRAQPAGRPLADELRLYRLEVSTGARRAESLRRLARRVDLASVSSFASALAHGEETGASIAGLLRPQAVLVRQRRRERENWRNSDHREYRHQRDEKRRQERFKDRRPVVGFDFELHFFFFCNELFPTFTKK